MTCRGICVPLKAKRIHGQGRYTNGQVRCQICEIFLNSKDCKKPDKKGLWCPCCGYRVRIKPRSREFKELYNNAKRL